MNPDIEWKDEKLEIDKDVKINYANDKSITISNLAEDISTQLTSIDNKLDQVLVCRIRWSNIFCYRYIKNIASI